MTRLAKRELSTWVNLRYLQEERRPFDLMIYAVRRRVPGNNFDKEQIRVQLQLHVGANSDVVTVYGAIDIFHVKEPIFCHSARDSGRTSPVNYRHSCNECYIGEIVHCATTSQKLLAHHDAAGTSELSDVAARSQGMMNRCSGQTSIIGESELRCGIFAAYKHLFEQNESDTVCCII